MMRAADLLLLLLLLTRSFTGGANANEVTTAPTRTMTTLETTGGGESSAPRPALENAIVYDCRALMGKTPWCGGLGDRISGLLTLAVMASISNRTLIALGLPGFQHIGPPLTISMLQEIESSEIVQRPDPFWQAGSLIPHSADENGMMKNHSLLRIRNSYNDLDFLATKYKHVYHMPPLHKLMQSLLRPSQGVQDIVNDMLRNKTRGRPFIGIHVRIGSTDLWQDPPRIPPSGIENFFRCALQLEELAYPDRSVDVAWYVTSDAPWVMDTFTREFGRRKIITSDFQPVHIDRPSKFSQDVELESTSTTALHATTAGTTTKLPGGRAPGSSVHTVADHIMLSLADYIVGSRSGFSHWAARRSSRPLYVWPFKEPCIPPKHRRRWTA